MSNCRGFTLLELLTVIAIIGVLAAMVTPGIGSILGNQKTRQASESLASSLRRAQVAAIEAATPTTATLSASSISVTGVRLRSFQSVLPDGLILSGTTSYVFEADGRASTSGATTIGAQNTSATKLLTVTPVGQVVVD